MTYLFYVSICTAGFYLLFHLVYHDRPQHHYNRWYLIGTLLLSWLIPAMQWELIPVEFIRQPLETPLLNTDPTTPTANNWDLWGWGLLIYLLGLSLMIGRFLIRLLQLNKLVRNGRHETREGRKVVYVKQAFPISSFLNYILVSDSRETPISDYEWQHELTHIQQGHTYDLLLIELSQAILWFNPVLLLYRRRLTEVHEYLADSYTCRALGQANYIQYILQQIEHGRPPVMAHSFYSLFKKRIQMMHSSASSRPWARLLVLPIILAALYAFTIKTYPVTILADDSAAPALDTVPLPDSVEWVDTIVIFDPATLKESVQIVRRKKTMPTAAVEKKFTGIDTIVTFDPETFKERVIIINHKLGTRDTIQ
jgi:hypothetical protein